MPKPIVHAGLALVCMGMAVAGCQQPPSTSSSEVRPMESAPVAETGFGAAITAFTARGNEPFWRVQVDGGTLTYSTPDLQPGKHLQASRRADADRVCFTGQDEAGEFSLDIRPVPCEDTMSGEAFEFSATFTYGGDTVTGCAKRGL